MSMMFYPTLRELLITLPKEDLALSNNLEINEAILLCSNLETYDSYIHIPADDSFSSSRRIIFFNQLIYFLQPDDHVFQSGDF